MTVDIAVKSGSFETSGDPRGQRCRGAHAQKRKLLIFAHYQSTDAAIVRSGTRLACFLQDINAFSFPWAKQGIRLERRCLNNIAAATFKMPPDQNMPGKSIKHQNLRSTVKDTALSFMRFILNLKKLEPASGGINFTS